VWLPGGSSLARLLGEHRGVRSHCYPPPLTEKQILAWADRHRERTGAWPTYRSGPVEGTPGETWRMVDTALRRGSRGLRGGRSLATLLATKRGARNRRNLPVLTVEQVLAWAKAHHGRTGTWPNDKSGAIAQAPGETWRGVDLALKGGYRGLKGGVSLARLLARELGIRNRTNLPALTSAEVVGWAKAHHRRTGEWPTRESGAIGGVPGETWHGVDLALRWGYRGLRGGSSWGDSCVSTAKGWAGPPRGRETRSRRSWLRTVAQSMPSPKGSRVLRRWFGRESQSSGGYTRSAIVRAPGRGILRTVYSWGRPAGLPAESVEKNADDVGRTYVFPGTPFPGGE
jgi:hypothetical protein